MYKRQVFVLAMGLLSLIISLIAQPLVLKVLGETCLLYTSVANPQKTDNGRLITGYACDSRTADAEFLLRCV